MQQVVDAFLRGGRGKGVGWLSKVSQHFLCSILSFFYLLLRSVAANVTCFYVLSARTLLRSPSRSHTSFSWFLSCAVYSVGYLAVFRSIYFE